MAAADCAIAERSARGYCPGEPGHADEVCGFPEHADAPFCGGPSLRECADGTEVPEADACPVEVEPASPPVVETLPETGPPAAASLVVVGAMLIAIGVSLLNRTGRERGRR